MTGATLFSERLARPLASNDVKTHINMIAILLHFRFPYLLFSARG
jgi:hypothetical protein